jgi:hypothetical protein
VVGSRSRYQKLFVAAGGDDALKILLMNHRGLSMRLEMEDELLK